MQRSLPIFPAACLVVMLAAFQARGQGGLGGFVAGAQGPGGDCITPAERQLIQQQVDIFRQAHPEPEGLPVPPTFAVFPQGGNLWQDLFIGSFCDLDPTPGILAWNCSAHTQDGHRGSDAALRSFGEQVIGVPVFAAADGAVAATHDGEPDMNVNPSGQLSNYVILAHPGGRDTWYLHLKNGSVAVSVGQQVKAGQQLGLTASSGNSAGPHLHFEVQDANVFQEPWAGACRPGPSLFTNQPAYQPNMFVGDFAVTRTIPSASPFPYEEPRSAYWLTTDVGFYFWVLVQNVPANTSYLVRFKRPDGSVSLQSGPWPFNNPEWHFAWWWFNWDYPELHQITGTWTLELELNGALVVSAPVAIFNTAPAGFNHAPAPVTAAIEPAQPGAGDVLVCRVSGPAVVDDVDWDIVRYQYVWKVNGQTVRSLTSAGKADMLPHHVAQRGDVVTCEVTPSDGFLSAPMASASVTIQALASNHPTLSLSQGGDIAFTLDLGPGYALAPYATVGSLTGTSPGVTVAPGVVVPLVVDSWTIGMIDYPNSPPYTASIGALDAQGIGRMHVTAPGGLPAGLAGTMIWHASLALGAPWSASNAVLLTAVP